MIHQKIMEELKKYVAYDYNGTVIYYNKAHIAVEKLLSELAEVSQYKICYQKWTDLLHASVFVCWIEEGTLFTEGFYEYT